jgi:6-pyruvoyltetrahydropterin/6-carboxytetrahydropterin synthase
MFELSVEVRFSAAHRIEGHAGRCANLHGHNYRVVVTVAGRKLNDQGMVIDFGKLKEICRTATDPLDHTYLNDLPAFAETNPTAEALARHIHELVTCGLADAAPGDVRVDGVTVYESDQSCATYRG